jgi:tellurium resistance protein TerD
MDDLANQAPRHFVKKGELFNLTTADPTINHISVGVGWDQKAFEENKIDADVSVFLLDKEGNTRNDDDFIFYNQPEACNGGIRHLGDNRTGAGDGDDEQIQIELNSIPFDVMHVAFVLSIYDDENRGYDFSMIRNVYWRIVNSDNNNEMVRLAVPEEDLAAGEKAMYLVTLNREGPEWFVEGKLQKVAGGLAAIATNHGIIVKELQSTGS